MAFESALSGAKTLLIVAIAALVVFAGLVVYRSSPGLPASYRLPGGGVISLHSHGFTNRFLLSGSGASWGPILDRLVPRFIRQKLRSAGGGSLQAGTSHGQNSLFVGVQLQGSNLNALPALQAVVSDEQGNRFGSPSAMAALSSAAKHYEVYGFDAFPRRGRELRLALHQVGGERGLGARVALFSIPNPDPGPHPSWSPEPLPATKTDGDLHVTLREFKTGFLTEDWALNMSEWLGVTSLRFSVSVGGRTEHPWRPKALEVIDATGNDWFPAVLHPRAVEGAPPDTWAFAGALWPGEEAWKLRVEFSRVAEFASDELWTLEHVPGPRGQRLIEFHGTNEINGLPLAITATARTEGELRAGSEWVPKKGVVDLTVRYDASAQGKRLTLLRVVDDQGREAKASEPHPEAAWLAFAVEVPPDTQELNFTFAVHRSRFVEFVAKPEQVGRGAAR
jgi:hypothetical protein